ncbi:MAG TPA: hypothetical protein PLX89_11375 [Verrucomicrobiota bacterium]|nr:hypothetical protein [Verrucomicrobiales bacterium]HRI13595.1 hypothetical protein [Verrucomicrobiota bacterium]
MIAADPMWADSSPFQAPTALLARTPLVSLAEKSEPRFKNLVTTSYLTPRIVPVRTRVVTGDGSRATNFSAIVGTNQYVATPIFSGTDDSAGFHLLVLERATLAMVTNFSASAPNAGTFAIFSTLNEMLARPDLLIIFYEMNPAGEDPFDNPLAVTLAGFGANSNALYNPANNQFAPAYAFIGNPGLSTNRSFEVSSYLNPAVTGQIEVVLTRDLNGNFFPVNPRFATVQISTGPGNDTVLIHNNSATNALTAPALLDGATGGFQLVVARRDILHQAATNPAAILTNQSYSTSAADLEDSINAVQALAAALQGYQAPMASGQVVVVLSSIGSPIPTSASQSSSYQSALSAVASVLQSNLGAVADLTQLQSGGYYSLLGIPWLLTNQTTKSVEIRSWTPSGTNATNLNVVLQGNPKGWFDPVAADTTGGVDYRLYEISVRPPVPWPVAPNASSVPCDAGDEACLAYQWVSTNIAENVAINSIRDIYLDIDSSFTGYRENIGSLVYDDSLKPYFSREVYHAVTNQLSLELFYMGFIQNLHTSLATLIADLASTQDSSLQSAVSTVIAQVSPPTATTVGFSLDAELRFIAQLGAALDPEPISKAALGVASACFSFAMQKKTTAEGNSDNRVEAEISQLASAVGGNMSTNLAGLGEMFRDIVTDWGKMSEVAVLTQGPPAAGNGFAWQDGTTGLVLENVLPAFYQLFYAELIPTLYQVVYFENVPFADPSSYFYRYDCVTWRTIICECEQNIYAPPSYDYFQPSGSSDIFMIATAAKTYPAASLMQTGLPENALAYLPDLFQGVGRWNGVLSQVLPQGWTDYLNNQSGVCDNVVAIASDSEGVLEIAIRGEPGRLFQLDRSTAGLGEWVPYLDPVRAENNLVVFRLPTNAPDLAFFHVRGVD